MQNAPLKLFVTGGKEERVVIQNDDDVVSVISSSDSGSDEVCYEVLSGWKKVLQDEIDLFVGVNNSKILYIYVSLSGRGCYMECIRRWLV